VGNRLREIAALLNPPGYPAGVSEGNVLYYGDNLDVLRRQPPTT